MAQLKIFAFNPLQVNAYLLYEPQGSGVLIDASCMNTREFGQLSAFIESQGIRLDYLLKTHGHFDHVFGAGMVAEAWKPKFLIHAEDELFLGRAADQARSFGFDFTGTMPTPDGYLGDGDIITSGPVRLEVIHVPGHSRGCVSFYERSKGWLFSGDTLFAHGIGRTDLPGGSYDQIMESIRTRLMVLPETTVVYPGHGPSTTIGEERPAFAPMNPV